MLLGVISVGVQTWGTDVVALRRYWQIADDLGFARITYGDGLWGWTHDGFADFPATGMVEVFAERVLPLLASRR